MQEKQNMPSLTNPSSVFHETVAAALEHIESLMESMVNFLRLNYRVIAEVERLLRQMETQPGADSTDLRNFLFVACEEQMNMLGLQLHTQAVHEVLLEMQNL